MAYTPWAATNMLASARLNAQTPVGAFELFIPAQAFWPWWAGPCLPHQLFHSGVADVVVLPFDPNGSQHAAAILALPKAVNAAAGVSAQIYWTNANGGAGDVVWPIWMGAAEHGNYIGNWVNTHYILSAAGPVNALTRSAVAAGAAVNNLAQHRLTQIIVARYGQAGNDLYPHFSYLIGVKLWFATNEVNDA